MTARTSGEATGTCRIEGCDKPYFAGKGCGDGMCAAHYRRKLRGRFSTAPVRQYRPTAWGRVVEASVAIADAETDEDMNRAKHRLRKACESWLAEEAA